MESVCTNNRILIDFCQDFGFVFSGCAEELSDPSLWDICEVLVEYPELVKAIVALINEATDQQAYCCLVLDIIETPTFSDLSNKDCRMLYVYLSRSLIDFTCDAEDKQLLAMGILLLDYSNFVEKIISILLSTNRFNCEINSTSTYNGALEFRSKHGYLYE